MPYIHQHKRDEHGCRIEDIHVLVVLDVVVDGGAFAGAELDEAEEDAVLESSQRKIRAAGEEN